MHGHGFALMFLACVYGMITKESLRQKVQAAVRKAVALTSQGQSLHGGWTYIPGGGDEGSVTVTQVQALRCAQRGVPGPKASIEEAVHYLERCRTPEGGIQYSLLSGGGPRLPISAAAVATLYNAGQFDSNIATDCLKYVWDKFRANEGWDKGDGHAFYAHLYAAQGFYMAGDQYWDAYFPATRDQLLAMQNPEGVVAGRRRRRSVRNRGRRRSSFSFRTSIFRSSSVSTRNGILKDKSTDDIDLAELEELRTAISRPFESRCRARSSARTKCSINS